MAKRSQISRKIIERHAGWMLLFAMLLTIWDIYLFRKTVIPLYLPLLIYVAGGLMLYLIVGRHMGYFKDNRHSVYLKALMGTILCGGPLLFTILALNYYVRIDTTTHTYHLYVIESGHLSAGRRGGCSSPYVVVRYKNLEKQLVLPCHAKVNDSRYANVTLQHGLFGFPVTDGLRLYYTAKGKEDPEQSAYEHLLQSAERALSDGNTQRAMELYKRAISFKPSDTLAQQGLERSRWRDRNTRLSIQISNIHPPIWLHGKWSNLLESNLHRSIHFGIREDRITHFLGIPDFKQVAAKEHFSSYSIQETITDTLYEIRLSKGQTSTSYSFRPFQQEGITTPAIAFSIYYNSTVLNNELMASGVLLAVPKTADPKP